MDTLTIVPEAPLCDANSRCVSPWTICNGMQVVLAGMRPLHKREELVLVEDMAELEGGAGGATAGVGGQASDCMEHQPPASSEPAAASQQGGGSQAQEADPLRGPVSRAAFRLLREWKGQRADMNGVDVMIADNETKSHLGMGGEVVYSKEHDVLVMGAPMQIIAIWRWRSVLCDGCRYAADNVTVHHRAHMLPAEHQRDCMLLMCSHHPPLFAAYSEDKDTGAEGQRACNETGAAAQDTCNISNQRCACTTSLGMPAIFYRKST